jgi:hypothetical protein
MAMVFPLSTILYVLEGRPAISPSDRARKLGLVRENLSKTDMTSLSIDENDVTRIRRT